MKFCASKEDAEEVMQDTFLIAHGKAGNLRSDTLVAYLRKIAIHGCYRKRSNNQAQFAAYDETHDTLTQEELNADLLPEEYIYNKEQREELLGIIMSLPKMQWETVYLYYYAMFDTHEIARLQGCSTSNVRKTLRTARATIKEKLEGKQKHKLPKGILLASAITVSLGALFLVEEQVFAATYLSAAVPYGVGAGVATTHTAATAAATGATATTISGYLIAACTVVVIIASALTYYTLWMDAASNYETFSPPPVNEYIVLETTPPAPPPLPTSSPTPPVTYPTEPEPYVPLHDPPPEPPPTTTTPEPVPVTSPPAATSPPITTTPPPQPADRTTKILAALANATTTQDITHILDYYNFDFERLIRDSGDEIRYYTVNEGSGDILVGFVICDNNHLQRLQFDLFQSGNMPHSVMDLLFFMD